MRYILSLCLLLSTIYCQAQNATDIAFEDKLNWTEIKKKAEKENKFIFVDCYATWCAPCKLMDKDVYTNPIVVEFLKANFISVKLQFDKNKNDVERVKKWRPVAGEFMQKYHINALPSLLFFSPKAKIIHRAVGYFPVKQFITSAQAALDPQMQYYTLLENYNNGIRNHETMLRLATKAKDIGDTSTAYHIGYDYVKNYLLKLPADELYTSENLEHLGVFTLNINSPGFDLYLNHPQEIDKVTKEYFSRDMVNFLLSKSYVAPFLFNGNKVADHAPDWSKIRVKITKRFGKYWADLVILSNKITYYQGNKQWKNYCTSVINFVDNYGPIGVNGTDWKYNNVAGEIFQYSDDSIQLKKALSWSEKSLQSTDYGVVQQSMDTYACLLYKLGRTSDAIAFEQKAVKYGDSSAVAHGAKQGYFHDYFLKTIEKMQNGEKVVW